MITRKIVKSDKDRNFDNEGKLNAQKTDRI